MKYLDLLNRFWRLHRERRFCQLDICLYMYILDEFNRARWPQSLPIPTSRISQSLNESAHSIIRSRSRLTERGLIGYTPGRSASAAAVYFFDGEYSDRLGCSVTDPSGNADSEAAASMDREQDSVLVGNAPASLPISGGSEDGKAAQRTVAALVSGADSDSAIGADSNADACSDTEHLYKIKDIKKKDNYLVVVNNAHARESECEDYMERFFAEENSSAITRRWRCRSRTERMRARRQPNTALVCGCSNVSCYVVLRLATIMLRVGEKVRQHCIGIQKYR